MYKFEEKRRLTTSTSDFFYLKIHFYTRKTEKFSVKCLEIRHNPNFSGPLHLKFCKISPSTHLEKYFLLLRENFSPPPPPRSWVLLRHWVKGQPGQLRILAKNCSHSTQNFLKNFFKMELLYHLILTINGHWF